MLDEGAEFVSDGGVEAPKTSQSDLSSKNSEKPGAPTPGFFIFSACLSPQCRRPG